jgi:Tol biopolymer transport system component
MDADGMNARQLTAEPWYDHGPSFSPDGSRIVFARQLDGTKFRPGTSASAELFVMNSDGTSPMRLTDNDWPDWEPSWCRDGRILFSVGSEEIWSTRPDGSKRVRLGPGSSPSASPDGRRVVFVSGGYGRAISIMNVDGSGGREVYRSHAYKSYPCFLADGTHVVFVEGPNGRDGSIYVLSLAGGAVKRITNTK